MMLKRSPLSSIAVLFVFGFTASASLARADEGGNQLPIPIRAQAKQSKDLIDATGAEVERDKVAEILARDHENRCHESGYLGQGCVDVSRYEPNPKYYSIWTPKSLPLSNAADLNFPPEGSVLQVLSGNDPFIDDNGAILDSSGMVRARVDHEGRKFRVVFDMDSHQSLMTAALLRHLGYTVDSPQHYERLTLRFKNADAMNDFLDDLVINSNFFYDRWVVSIDKEKFELVVRDVNIETPRIETPSYYFGRIANSWVKDRRATRALLLPLSLLDVRLSTRSINLFPWEFSKVMAEMILMEHPYATAFNNEATYEDLRWIARKVGAIPREKWAEIVAEAHFPVCIEQMVLRKVFARRDDMLADFNLLPEFKQRARADREIEVEIASRGEDRFSCGQEIKKGKVTQEYYDNHAERFTVGDPLSPLRWHELRHYVKMELISQAVNVMTAYVNKNLQLKTVQQGFTEHLDDMMKDRAEWALNHPGVAYTIPLDGWAKPLVGGSLSATRSLTTGTYYGSDSKAQLVDNMAIGLNLGAFGGVTGNSKYLARISATAGVALQRSFTHVRPITSLSAVKKEKWKNLMVPAFMADLGKIINPVKKGKKLSNAEVTEALKNFLSNLNEGEVFTITDAYVSRINPQYTIPLTALIGDLIPNPITQKLSPSVGVGVTGEFAIIKRVMFSRKNGRLEVYDNSMKTRALGGNLDLNVWMKVASGQIQNKRGTADTDVYYLDTTSVEDEAKIADSDLNTDRRRLMTALHKIMLMNETEVARQYFPPTHFDHKLKGNSRAGKVLWWNWNYYDENHTLVVAPPKDPEDRHTTEKRTLYSSRRLNLAGKDMFSFIGQVISKISKVPGLLAASGSADPAGTLLGKSSRSQVRTEAEITQGTAFTPMVFLEDSYQGWFLSHDNLIKILDRIQDRLIEANMGLPIFHAASFNNTKTVQNYEIRSQIMIYPAGVAKFLDHLEKAPSRRDFMLRLVDLTDDDDLKNRCRDSLRDARSEAVLATAEALGEKNETMVKKCVHPWMRKAMRRFRKAPSVALPKDRVQWINHTVHMLEKHVSLARMLKFIGTENYFFQMQVNGFRTKDENGDAPYLTDSIGTVSSPLSLGPFRDLRLFQNGEEWNVSTYETEARYFGNGL